MKLQTNRMIVEFTRILVFSVIYLGSVTTVFASPRLTIANSDMKFGMVPSNSDVIYEYWLHSTGASELIIEWIDGGCPCASLSLAQDHLAPGDSVAFELTVHTGRTSGALSNKPRIKTNADSKPFRADFSAFVAIDSKFALPIGTYPFRAELSSFGKYHQDTARIEIYNNSDKTFSLEMIYTRPEYFSVILPDSVLPGKKETCLVILNPDSPDNEFKKSFTVEGVVKRIGDDPERHRFTIPVRRKYSE